MRLSKIKLAGFKSFVDPTSISLPSNLIGIVGPNGCGKSNVIDAVRWVMGESSAKHLRGDSMADVIFNGSSTRKPVGNASVELVFDNSDGVVGGVYAKYSEISIKRVVSRDGTSLYYLNNARCRRKDITHIFLGTGLGPRSYAIIEQGMISRLIEAKPEELRTYLDEAAGISKYKERRRETEYRIRHTRENLERLNDLRDEVEKQIKHLQRQARAAERYKKLKNEERRTGAEVLGLKLLNLTAQHDTKKTLLAERETALQAAIAAQRSIEAAIEEARELLAERSEAFNEVQGCYYRVGSEIARLEQSIKHGKELRQRQHHELRQAEHGLEDLSIHINRDKEQLAELDRTLEELGPDLERAQEAETNSQKALQEADAAMQRWQDAWETYTTEASDAQRQTQVERTRIEHLETQLGRFVRQRDRIAEEQKTFSLNTVEKELDGLRENENKARFQYEALQTKLEAEVDQIRSLREQDQKLTPHLDECRGELQQVRGKLASLEAIQQAALGQQKGSVTDWLERKDLDGLPRLAQQLEVESGWERAVETVLGSFLEAVCVDGFDTVTGALESFDKGSVTFFDVGARASHTDNDKVSATLLGKVQGETALASLLGDVLVADGLPDALTLRPNLAAGQSVITQDGIWIGQDWLRVNRAKDEHAGVISREKEITDLRGIERSHTERADHVEELVTETRHRLKQLEESRENDQHDVNTAHQLHTDFKARLDGCQARKERITEQIGEKRAQRQELEREIEGTERELKDIRSRLEQGVANMATLEHRREDLETQKSDLRAEVERVADRAKIDRTAAHEIDIQVESRRSTKDTASQSLERMQRQLGLFSERKFELEEQLEEGEAPIAHMQEQLAEQLQERVDIEREMAESRKGVESAEDSLRQQEQLRGDKENAVDEVRVSLDQVKMQAQEVKVRRETLADRLADAGFTLEPIVEELPEEATVASWEEKLEKLATRIHRLGPINLAAIEEYKEQSERKEYLDSQYEDLTDALSTLGNAIRKIDRETRSRFKETFDKVNAGMKKIFPRLFGGGHAYLELHGDDLLDSGITVMARPPGKRISTIHLMSGGEKALTAVALVFAIFELNPAPFCLLDEVDAPLDDANVGRFCDIVREMSERVQFVFITHNKATLEMSRQLMGVTMQEPGVSRLVAVDVDEAVQLAAS